MLSNAVQKQTTDHAKHHTCMDRCYIKRVAMNLLDSQSYEYHSYLLRLWREGAQGSWRGSLQDTATGQISYFASVESLYSFLMASIEGQAEASLSEDAGSMQ